MNIMIVNKWFFPVVAAVLMGYFYTVEPDSISHTSIVIVTILTFIGVSVTERLDWIIRHQAERIIKND